VKGNGLAVHGTPTVSAVATGAELKAISGFSTSNYLEQPYNSDLDFGTGDFSVSGWVNSSRTTGYGDIIAVGNIGTTSFSTAATGSWFIQMKPDRGITIYYIKSSGTGSASWTTGTTLNGWSMFTVVRSGGSLLIYLDGVLNTSAAISVSDTFTPAIASPCNIGWQGTGYSYPCTTEKLALLRISATAPTAEQIKEIYEAEKPMFQENAKCTLNGSSDAVTALAYDDDTELLHVGTSGGRSAFQGLRRVDETSTSTTEIAAQGGLIVEET
jgi:hypothetical protein